MKINLFGGPGIGKSTVAYFVGAELKSRGLNVEIVQEFAKEVVYEGIDLRKVDQNFQDRILMEQIRRELVFINRVDFVITDSPIFLNLFYNKDENKIPLAKITETGKDLNFYLTRTTEKFETTGRSHNELESLKIDKDMLDFLKKHNINLIEIDGDSREKAIKIVNIITGSQNA